MNISTKKLIQIFDQNIVLWKHFFDHRYCYVEIETMTVTFPWRK